MDAATEDVAVEDIRIVDPESVVMELDEANMLEEGVKIIGSVAVLVLTEYVSVRLP